MGLNPTILRQSGRRVPPQFNGSLIPRRRPYRASGLVLTSTPAVRSAQIAALPQGIGKRDQSEPLLPFDSVSEPQEGATGGHLRIATDKMAGV